MMTMRTVRGQSKLLLLALERSRSMLLKVFLPDVIDFAAIIK